MKIKNFFAYCGCGSVIFRANQSALAGLENKDNVSKSPVSLFVKLDSISCPVVFTFLIK